MKKICCIFICLLLANVLFVSCEKDENKDDYQKSNYLVGKWEIKQIGEIQNINNTNVVVYENYPNNGNYENDFYMFNEDFTFSINEVNFLNGNCENQLIIHGNFYIRDDTVILKYMDEVNGNNVELTSTGTVINNTDKILEISFKNDLGEVNFMKLQRR